MLWCVSLCSSLPSSSPKLTNHPGKTGQCGNLESAFADAAAKFAALPASQQSPHLASTNCDDQPVLCNSWSANGGGLWLWQLLPAPAPVDIMTKRVNLTTVSGQDVVDYYTATNRTAAGWRTVSQDGYFHPTEGTFAKLGLSVPLGYLFWGLNIIPSWGMMLIVSFASRYMM